MDNTKKKQPSGCFFCICYFKFYRAIQLDGLTGELPFQIWN